MEGLTGKKLNELWDIGAAQCFYRRNGKWYHPLKKFPAALCDKEGYVYFPSEDAYTNCEQLRITQKSVHIGGNGISDISEYVNVVEQSTRQSWWSRIKLFFTGGLTNEK